MLESSIIAARLQMARDADAKVLAQHLDRTVQQVHIDAADESLAVEKRSNALQTACWSGNVDTVSLLLSRGANPNSTRQHNGGTCLCIAAHAGHCAVVRALVHHGATLNLPNNNGASPVFIAAEHGHKETVAVLLAMGANPDTPDRKGCSPCYIATSRGHLACLRVLRRYGANLDAVTKEDHAAPLHIAVGRGRLTAFEMLLDAGARTDLQVLGEPRREGRQVAWSVRQLIMIKFGLHASTRQAFLDSLSIAEDDGPVVAARQRLAWMGRRIAAAVDLTTDLKRLVGERMLSPRARLAVARRGAVEAAQAYADAITDPGPAVAASRGDPAAAATRSVAVARRDAAEQNNKSKRRRLASSDVSCDAD